MTEKIKHQILEIRDTGKTNMFDTKAVQTLANEHGFYELVIFIEENKKEYSRFILTGESNSIGNSENKSGNTIFIKKTSKISEVKEYAKSLSNKNKFIIEKEIELSTDEFLYFSNNLLDDYSFIKENIELMHVDKKRIWHCLLVCESGSRNGILVQAEGYNYPRYTGYYEG